MLAVGADLSRVQWAIDRVRATNTDVPIGSFVNVVVHDDAEIGRSLAAGGVATFARFSVMDGQVRTPIDADSEVVLGQVHDAYDMTKHTRSGSAQAGTLSGEFTDRFAVVGSAEHCIERLRSLIALGIDRLVVVGPSMDADVAAGRAARRRMVAEVLPALRG